MDARRWEQLQELFHATVDLPPVERKSRLETACAGDPELLADVIALLSADDASSSLLDRHVANVAAELMSEDASLPTHRFGQYRVTRMLGEGGMGVVYLGQRDDLGSFAAIKILRDAWLSPARRERFASEQRLLAQLNHPAIARLLDADTLPDGTPWFVMEYVPGVTLTDHCRIRGSGLEERLKLFREVCEAVQHAHRHAVIHRDLKPSNILVTPDGRIKLLDFGIAKQVESLDLAVDQTRSGLRMMTPAYAAPEQVRGERLGVHTDVYSLGVVLYQLLLEQLPFDLAHRTPSEADTLIVEKDAERPSVVARRLLPLPAHLQGLGKSAWGDLDVLCLTAMQKEPSRRYRTVDALIRDIDHYLAGEPLDARADTIGYRVSKFLRRNTAKVTAAAGALVVVIALIVINDIRLARARNNAVVEAARAERIERFMLDLFQGNDASAGPADSLRVLTLLDRGVQEARSLGAEPAVQAELYRTLGGIYQKLGQFDRADTLLQLALTKPGTLPADKDPFRASTLVSLGLLRIDQARYDDAVKLIQQGMTVQAAVLPPDHPDAGRAQLALGRALEERGDYAEAIPPLEAAVRIQTAQSEGSATPELAEAIEELANTHFQAGRYDLSDSLNRVVLTMNRALHGDAHPTIADVLINLGAIRFQKGDYVEAERFDREALKIDLAWYGPDHYETASAMTLVGRALVYQKRFPEAVAILRQSLAIQERVNGPNHPRVASALNDLGLAATKGGQFDEAEADFRRMDAIYHQVYGDHHFLIAIARSNLATVFLERKEYARAEQMYRDVVARFTSTQGPTHMNTAIARIKLGRALLRQGKLRDAETESEAGYGLLKGQTASSVSWIKSAREDLLAVYDSLHESAKASEIRREMTDTLSKGVTAGRGN